MFRQFLPSAPVRHRPGATGVEPARRTGRGGASALLVALAVLVSLGTQDATAFAAAHAPLNLPAPRTPAQLAGTADGRPDSVPASATSKSGTGKGDNHTPGRGELPQPKSAGAPASGPSLDARTAQPVKTTAPPDWLEGRAAKPDGTPAASARRPASTELKAKNGLPGPGSDGDTGVEEPSARTVNTTQYRNNDGTKTTRVYSRPINYQTGDGTWLPIDTTVTLGRDNRWRETGNSRQVSLAAQADSPSLLTYTLDDGHELSFGLAGTTPVRGSAAGDTVTYPLAAPQTDLVYNAIADGMKETLVLHDASAPTTWTFPLRLRGLTASLDGNGAVVFKDEQGAVRATIPAGSMVDAASDPRTGEGRTSSGVTYTLTTADGAPALRMDLDTAWLHDPQRAFPVRVDPTTAGITGDSSTYVISGYTNDNSADRELHVGRYDSQHVGRGFIAFPGVSSNLANQFVEAVDLHIANTHSNSCTRNTVNVYQVTNSWSASGMRTFPGAGLGQLVGTEKFADGDLCGGVQWETIHLGKDQTSPGSQLVNSWTHGQPNYGLAITADESTVNAYKRFDSAVTGAYAPYLSITSSDWAASYTGVANYIPPTAVQPGSAQITLRNEAANWWNSNSMQVRARVYDANWNEVVGAGPLVGVPGLVQTGQSTTVTVAIPALPAGNQYQVCWDGTVNGTSSLNDSYGVHYQNCIWASAQNIPPQVDTALPLGDTQVGVLAPELYATGHDPDNYPGTGVDFRFQVYSAPAVGDPQLIADSGWQPSSSWKVPDGLLAWNSSYYWTVKAGDHQGESLPSVPRSFSTSVQQPVVTSRIGGAVGNGTTRSFDPQAGNYTTGATDAMVAAVGPSLAVSRTYNSLDPRTGSLFGAGWSSSYDLSVVPDGDSDGGVVLTTGNGRTERFGRNDFQLTQLAAAGDQTGDGIDDAIAVDASTGKLWVYPGPDFSQAKRRWLGDGWNSVSQIAGADLNGDGIGDVIAVAGWNGALNLYAGQSGSNLGAITAIGASGWNGMRNVAITPPLAADGKKDIVAVDSSDNNMYAYPVNANGSLGARVYLGNGWDPGYRDVIGGDFNHDRRGDVVTVDSSGRLLLYPGTGSATLGTGTLGGPTVLATGWQNMRDLAPVNGIPGDQGTDLLAVDRTTGVQYLYRTGSTPPGSPLTRTTTGMALYTSPAGEFETLAANPGGGFTLADKSGTVYTFAQPSGSGFLLSQITDRQQHTQQLHYTAGKLDTATDQASGRALHFTWSADGKHIAAVATDPTTPGDPSTALTWTYTYDSANPDRLAQVCTPPAGTNTTRPCTTYTYSPGSHFRTTVMDAGPSSYWRLGDAADATNATSENIANQGTDKGTYTSVTLGTGTGPLNGSATTTASFDGTASSLALPNGTLRNSYLAVGLWFKTTSPGALVGYQNQPLGTAPSHASQPLYIGTDGKLRGELYGTAIGFNPITSATPVTDGKWHYAVLSGAGDTQTLYLDGAPVGTLNGAIDHLDTDYTYLGAGYTQNIPWPAAPAPGAAGVNHFNGQLAEAAVYPHALGAPAVAAQWAASQVPSAQLTNVALPSGKTKLAVSYDTVNDRATQYTDPNGGIWKLNQPTVTGSEQEYRGTVLGSRPDGYWRLAESNASQAANAIYTPRPTPNNGTYSNVTLGAPGPMTATTAATFDGTTSWAELPATYTPTTGTGALALWFKTTKPGTLLGYQSFPIGGTHTVTADRWTPALYVGTDGKLHGEFWTGGPTPIASSATVTDGKWHQAVLSADTPTTQTLYLDGQSAGTATGQIKDNGQTHLYLGAGYAGPGWPSAPADPFGHFNGQIADVAAFDHGIDAAALFAQAANGSAAYDGAVVDAHPTGYWRLNDTAGNQMAELLTSQALTQNQGTYSNTTQAAGGPYATGNTNATTFNGTTSAVRLPANAAPRVGNTATVEVWFKTANAGVIYSYQSDPLGSTPATSTPVLYVGTDGKLHGQVWNGDKNNTIASATTVNDNAWHMATLVIGYTSGNYFQQLYLDGTATGNRITGPTKYSSTQYSYLGAGSATGWPSAPADANGHFTGQIADLSYYGYALDTTIIGRHYTAATAPAGEAVTQSANYRTSVIGSVPEAYWRLNEPAGSTVVQDTLGTPLPNQEHGTYTNTTLGATGPSGSSDGTGATFNGTTSLLQLPSSAAPRHGANSIELWFKTSTAGVLYSYQSFPLGTAHTAGTNQWNPALYVGADGRLYGGLWTGDPANTLASTKTVNDNAWHHAVIAGDDNGQTLYLDGAGAASSTVKRTVYYNGAAYVYVGAGTDDGGWPNHPASTDGRFTGTIAEVAHYPSVLGADTVTAHYKAMGSATAQTKTTVATVSDPASHTLTWRWDTRTGQLAATTDGTAATSRYSYDTHGFLYSTTDANGHSTTTGHDERGNPVSTTTCTDAAHCHTAYASYSYSEGNPFDPSNDRRLTSTDARAKDASDSTYATTYGYNTLGDPTTTTTPATPDFPGGRTATTTYTTGTEPAVGSTGTQPAALVATTTDVGGATTAYAYDKTGNLTRTTTPTGLVTTRTYDNLGRTTATTTTCTDCGNAAASTTTAYTWDGLGNPLTQTDPATTDAVTGTVHTRKTALTYDTDGNLTTRTVSDTTGGDASRTTTWAYNTTNNLLNKTTDPAGRTTVYTYDAYGNVTNRTDPAGTRWSYTYDGRNRLVRTGIGNYTGSPLDPVPSRAQVLEARAYDPAGRLATVTDAMGRTTHTYYNDDNTVAEVDLDAYRSPDGTQRTVVLQQNTYDAAGRLTQQTTGGGKTTVATVYDAAGRTTATTLDPGGLNRTTAYTYDAADNVLTTVLSGGGETRETDATYNSVGQVLTQTVKNTPADSTVKNTYDQRGLPLTTISPLGNTAGADPAAYTTTYSHDALGRLTLTTAPPADTTTVDPATGTATVLHGTRAISRAGYGIDDDPTSTQDPTGSITTYTHTWDPATGHHESVASPSYAAPGQTAAVTAITQIDYDALDRPQRQLDAKNQLTTHTYDQLGNLVATDYPQLAGTAPKAYATFDLAGDLLSATDPTGARTESTYDDLGRPITTTDLVRHPTTATDAFTTTLEYDDAGNTTSVTTPTGARTTATYNAAGENTSVTDPLGNTTTSTYNLAGQPLKNTQPGDQPGTPGPATTIGYDRAGQMKTTTRLSAAGAVLASSAASYDVAGNPVSATDADGNTTTAAYDNLGRIVRHIEPVSATANVTTAFGYDATGHRTAYTDGNGNTTYYTFNTHGLPESTIEPATPAYPSVADRTYTLGYDLLDAPTTKNEPGGVTLTNAYDVLGNLTAQNGTGGEAATNPARTFGYDLAGRLTSMSAPTGTQTYTYDDRGQLTAANGPLSHATYTYNGDGNLTRRTNESGPATYTYDNAGRLKTFAEPLTNTLLTYSYTTRDQVATIQYGTGNNRTYTYDDLGNTTGDSLTTATGTAVSSLTYTYFPSGRLKTKTTAGLAGASTNTYAYDQAGRLSTWTNGATPTSYGYDGNGNLTANGANTATYNQRNQLTSNSLGTSYTYTARGTRSTSTTGNATTTATYDAYDNLTAQQGQTYTYDALGRLTQSGTHAFTYDGPTGTLTSDGTENYSRTPRGTLTAIGSANSAALAYTDRHDDLIGTFAATGTAPTASTAYDPWGKPTGSTGNPASLGYQGGWTDTTTGQVSTASRWYDPATAGFTSRDTATLAPTTAATANTYSYGAGDPLANTDPSGHNPCTSGPRPSRDGSPTNPYGNRTAKNRQATMERYYDLSSYNSRSNGNPNRAQRNQQATMERYSDLARYSAAGGGGQTAADYGSSAWQKRGSGYGSGKNGRDPRVTKMEKESFSFQRWAPAGNSKRGGDEYGLAAGYDDCDDNSGSNGYRPPRIDWTRVEPGHNPNSDNTPAASSLNGQQAGQTQNIVASASNPAAAAASLQAAGAPGSAPAPSSGEDDPENWGSCLRSRPPGAEDLGTGWVNYEPLEAPTNRSFGAEACMVGTNALAEFPTDAGDGQKATQSPIAGWAEAQRMAAKYPEASSVSRCHFIPRQLGGSGRAENLAPCWQYPVNTGSGSMMDYQDFADSYLRKGNVVEMAVYAHYQKGDTVPFGFGIAVWVWDKEGKLVKTMRTPTDHWLENRWGNINLATGRETW
ncbi:LamG-like jellyroll fold domain-containing protein [Kitasatospora cheerisanensis]|nr:LamG-like jellyroll fold domain-containing protein [Kitasatospora cheerisanensis]